MGTEIFYDGDWVPVLESAEAVVALLTEAEDLKDYASSEPEALRGHTEREPVRFIQLHPADEPPGSVMWLRPGQIQGVADIADSDPDP